MSTCERCFEDLGCTCKEEDRIAELEAKVKRLNKVINDAKCIALDAPELNMANYDEEQIQELNDAMIELYSYLEKESRDEPMDTTTD